MGSAACFDSPSWYELVVEGRKIAGSAQTRQKGVVLQHGSILLDLDADQLFRLLRFRSERLEQRLKESFRSKAVAINDLLRGLARPALELSDLVPAFRGGLERGLGVELKEGGLTDYERALAKRLAEEKYGSKEWNLRR